MQIYHGLHEVPADLGATAVTIGNFDGVHLGHQHVLAQVTQQAQRRRARSIAVTFDPHPAFIHRPEAVPQLLTGTEEKLSRMQAAGLDATLVLNYTPQLADHTAEDFVKRFFVEALNPSVVVVGYDVRFGRGNAGNFNTLVALGEQYGFDVVGVDDYGMPGIEQQLGARCSSTGIRTALHHGDVAEAAQMLGRPHSVTGEVVHGEARGRQLGFPTANLSQDSAGLVPADGVYAGWVRAADQQPRPAAISVGSNPTFQGIQRVVEAHIIDRPQEQVEDFDLYGQQMRVEFVQRLRGMVTYEGIEKLVAQMHQDVAATRSVLSGSAADADR